MPTKHKPTDPCVASETAKTSSHDISTTSSKNSSTLKDSSSSDDDIPLSTLRQKLQNKNNNVTPSKKQKKIKTHLRNKLETLQKDPEEVQNQSRMLLFKQIKSNTILKRIN